MSIATATQIKDAHLTGVDAFIDDDHTGFTEARAGTLGAGLRAPSDSSDDAVSQRNPS